MLSRLSCVIPFDNKKRRNAVIIFFASREVRSIPTLLLQFTWQTNEPSPVYRVVI